MPPTAAGWSISATAGSSTNSLPAPRHTAGSQNEKGRRFCTGLLRVDSIRLVCPLPARFLTSSAGEVPVVHAAAATTAATIATAATASAAAAKAAFRLRTRFVDHQRAAVHLLFVEVGDRFLGFFICA